MDNGAGLCTLEQWCPVEGGSPSGGERERAGGGSYYGTLSNGQWVDVGEGVNKCTQTQSKPAAPIPL